MPTYEYACRACKKSFSLHLTVADHDKKRSPAPNAKAGKWSSSSARSSR